MPLFVPTGIGEPFTARSYTQGQLYNLDENRKLGFQFNPESLEVPEEFAWPETSWRGAPSVDLTYTGTKLRTFDLNLRYMADPVAPDFETENTYYVVKQPDVKADFDMILAEIRHWLEPLPNKRRPCRVMVIFGTVHAYEGVITHLTPHYAKAFSDASTRRSELRISFKEWSPLF